MVNFEHVAVFWDYENCAPPSGVPGYDIVNSIRQTAHRFGSIKLFKAYLELSELSSPKSLSLRSELQSCGVSLTDCPHNGRKDVADKMMIVDMLTYAIDTPAPATIILISGDRDFVYAVSVLRFRRYRVVLLAPGKTHASLKAQASEVLHWDVDVLGKEPVSARCGLQSTPRAPDEPPSNLHRRNSSVPSVLPAASAPRPTPIMPLRESVPKSAPSVMSPASGHQNSSSEPPSKLGIADRMAPQPAPQTLPQVTGGFAEPQSPLISQSEVSENEGPISDINVHLKTLHDMRSVSGTSSSSYIGESDAFSVSASPTLVNVPSMDHEPLAEVTQTSVNVPPQRTNDNSGLSVIQVQSAPVSPTTDQYASSASSSSSSKRVQELLMHPASVESPSPTAVRPPDATIPAKRTTVGTVGDPPHLKRPANGLSAHPFPSPSQHATPATPPSPPPVPPQFSTLVQVLQGCRDAGIEQPSRKDVAYTLVGYDCDVYTRAGVVRFGEYAALAQKAGIVALGGPQNAPWIALAPVWQDRR